MTRLMTALLALVSMTSPAEADGSPPPLAPVPTEVPGLPSPSIDLNGTWKLTLDPPPRFFADDVDPSSWSDVGVPGEALMQGFDIRRDREFVYKRSVAIPASFAGCDLRLRFDGVYSHARLWVNGHFVREHHGGFTSWEAEITPHVEPGTTAWITVGVTDRSDEISWGSAYAKHDIGGILRGVRLIARPPDHVSRLHLDTDLDDRYRDARLSVTMEVRFQGGNAASAGLTLFDPQGATVPISPRVARLTSEEPSTALEIPVSAPLLWEAEHPHLYTLSLELEVGGRPVERVVRRFGFREVEVEGRELLVNGRPVTLLGVNRHDVHPTRGRSTTPELDALDARLLKEANVNFVRTSHYPPSEDFLAACDELGIYVEEETAVCFIGTHGDQATSDDPVFASRYLDQFAEMIERDRDHPSVILWSLGNESVWGGNFALELDHVRREDPSRPVIFSYPHTMPPGAGPVDIDSAHYLRTRDHLAGQFGHSYDARDHRGGTRTTGPVLHDEFAHVACYANEDLRLGDGIRNAWGASLERFADIFFTTRGALGGAIWGGVDEVFHVPLEERELPDDSGRFSPLGYGPWGIIDGWRRKKPEHWLTRKAFSPIGLTDGPVPRPPDGEPLRLVIDNRFDHTNLSEIVVRWRAGGERGQMAGPEVPPHGTGELTLPPREWTVGEILEVSFLRANGIPVDEFRLPLYPARHFDSRWYGDDAIRHDHDRARHRFDPPAGPAPDIEEEPGTIRLSGSRHLVEVDRATGLIRRAALDGRTLIEGGPFFHADGVDPSTWTLDSLETAVEGPEALIRMAGSYGDDARVHLVLRLDGQGLLTTEYAVDQPPRVPWDSDFSAPHLGFREVGLSFLLPNDVDRLTWQRRGLWSAYPNHHIGRTAGTARRRRLDGHEAYGVEPTWPWAHDMKDFHLNGRDDPGFDATRDFRAMRENVYFLSALRAGSPLRVRVESDGSLATRAEVVTSEDRRHVRLVALNLWSFLGLAWGNAVGDPVVLTSGYQDQIRVRLTDNDRYAAEP